jgi:hypothetical protein
MFAQRRFKRWLARSEPYLERFRTSLAVVGTTSPANTTFVADQVGAAVREFATYLRDEPCPNATLNRIYGTTVAIYSELACLLSGFDRMARPDQVAAHDRVIELAGEVATVVRLFP